MATSRGMDDVQDEIYRLAANPVFVLGEGQFVHEHEHARYTLLVSGPSKMDERPYVPTRWMGESE